MSVNHRALIIILLHPFLSNRPCISQPSTLSIPHDVPRPGRDTIPRGELVTESIAAITAARVDGEVIASGARILCEADAAGRCLTLGAACRGIADADLVDAYAVVGGVAGLVDALVAVGGADDVVALTLAIDCRGGGRDGYSVGGRDC